jgi:transcriptional regulator with XRE-family HTH domain
MPGLVIKALREKKGLKQDTVARQMGISQAAYSKIENNITNLTVKHCKILSRILGEDVYNYLPDDLEIVRRPNSHRPLAALAPSLPNTNSDSTPD